MKVTITTTRIQQLKDALPFWCSQFELACIFNSNNISSAANNNSYELIAGVANAHALKYYDIPDDASAHPWKLGYLTYEHFHKLHGFDTVKHAEHGFREAFFFVPQILISLRWNSDILEIEGAEEVLIEEIIQYKKTNESNSEIKLSPTVDRDTYLNNVEAIKKKIEEGTYYELNYCMEFCQEDVILNAPRVFNKLNHISPTPFACYFKHGHSYLLCASPERFIKKQGPTIIAQPIKGTASRNSDPEIDALLKLQLQQSEKERAENIMIVDLMRNDLAKCAETGTVKVDELFGVYSFATVHQLISTVSANLKLSIDIPEILKNTFPMGSMTGAPKREVMHAIDRLEPKARGIFSGTAGYISPENDFDFNVVIRSIIYDEAKKHISLFVGSAITYDADAAAEYEECLLKAQTMFNALDTSKIVT